MTTSCYGLDQQICYVTPIVFEMSQQISAFCILTQNVYSPQILMHCYQPADCHNAEDRRGPVPLLPSSEIKRVCEVSHGYRMRCDAVQMLQQMSGVLTSGLQNIPVKTVGTFKTVRVTIQKVAFRFRFVSLYI